jgi:hypothetical protein
MYFINGLTLFYFSVFVFSIFYFLFSTYCSPLTAVLLFHCHLIAVSLFIYIVHAFSSLRHLILLTFREASSVGSYEIFQSNLTDCKNTID